MSSSIEELATRLDELKKLAEQIHSDTRALSFPLETRHSVTVSDGLVSAAAVLKVPLHHPLTIGTLLASILGEIDSVEWALKSLLARMSHSNEQH